MPDTLTLSVQYVPGGIDTASGSVYIVLRTTGACLNQSDTMNITIQRQPYLVAGSDTTLPSSPDANATFPLSPYAVNVTGLTWTTTGTGTFTPSDTSLNAVYHPSSDDLKLDSIIIIATTNGSCSPVVDSIIVDFAPFFIPNIFSPYPTSPGYNDFFQVRYLTSNVILKVWDRWGSLVYTSQYYQNDWDAHGLKADVYYYVVISKDKSYKGWVQVIRDE